MQTFLKDSEFDSVGNFWRFCFIVVFKENLIGNCKGSPLSAPSCSTAELQVLVMCWLGSAWKPQLKLSLEWLRACQNWSPSCSQGLGLAWAWPGLRPWLVWGKVGCIKSRHTRQKSNGPAAPHHHPRHEQQAHPMRIVPLAQMPHWNQYQHLQYPHHQALSVRGCHWTTYISPAKCQAKLDIASFWRTWLCGWSFPNTFSITEQWRTSWKKRSWW